MEDQLKNIEQIQKVIESKLEEATKAKGVVEQIDIRLKDEFGINNIDEVSPKLVELEKEKAGLTEKIDRTLNRLQEKYGWPTR